MNSVLSANSNNDTKKVKRTLQEKLTKPVSVMKYLPENSREDTSKWNPAIYKKG